MAEGLKLVNDIYKRAKEQHGTDTAAWLGINVAVLILSSPENADLWRRLVRYCTIPECPQCYGHLMYFSGPPEFLYCPDCMDYQYSTMEPYQVIGKLVGELWLV